MFVKEYQAPQKCKVWVHVDNVLQYMKRVDYQAGHKDVECRYQPLKQDNGEECGNTKWV